jgi:CheY-like chemotaxis protein
MDIPTVNRRQKTVLIVDDNKNNCEMCKIYLELEGYSVFFAEHGKAALQQIRNILPDLILLDIIMPVMDGYQLIEQLKDDPALKDIPILVHSVSSDPHEVVRTLQMGANDFIKKPFDVDELIARVDKQLTIKQNQDSLKETSRYLWEQQRAIEAEMEKWSRQAETFQKEIETTISSPSRNKKENFNLEQALQATQQVSHLLNQVINFQRRKNHVRQPVNI